MSIGSTADQMRWSVEHGMVVRRIGESPQNRAPLVWIHGLGESSVSFEPVIAKLEGYVHVLVDLPGYGRSPWPRSEREVADAAYEEIVSDAKRHYALPDDAYVEAAGTFEDWKKARPTSLETLASTLTAWLATQPPSVLLGHSMGGVLATLVAERTPVRGVVNIDGNLTYGDCTFSATAAKYSLPDFISRGFDEMRANVFADAANRRDLRTYHAAMCFASPRIFHENAEDLVALSRTNTLAPRFAALKAPKLFIAGVPNGICAESRELLKSLNIPWRGIEPAGHWVYLDQTQRFVDEVDRFARLLPVV